MLLGIGSAAAFDTDLFPRESVLASGRWIKISVDESSLYRIPASTLRSWGFGDASKVRIYGGSGARMGDALTVENIVPDLQLLQNTVASDGSVIFYGTAPGEWTATSEGLLYFEPNVYSAATYYFVTQTDTIEARTIEKAAAMSLDPSTARATTFMQPLHYERELFSPGEAGPLLLGEDFRYTPNRNFDFTLPAPAAAGARVWCRVSFVSRYTAGSPSLSVNVANSDIPVSETRLTLVGDSKYTHGSETVATRSGTLTAAASSVRVGLTLNGNSSSNTAALNSITLAYSRELTLPAAGHLCFDMVDPAVSMQAENAASVTLWDVSDPLDIKAVTPSATSADRLDWEAAAYGRTFYAAFRDGASIPAPKFVEAMENQNLHGDDSPDMIIVAPSAYLTQARRLADLHANSEDSLTVAVVDVDKIYNEFSAGRAEAAGLRNYFKMLYDRGQAGQGKPLRFALIFARMTYDNRHLVAAAGSYPTIPGWTPRPLRSSLSDNEGYFTDDFYAMLDDNAATVMRTDKLRLAIGRIPATDVSEAQNIVDKAIEYTNSARRTSWKQRVIMLADDGDRGVHLRQSETMASGYVDRPGVPLQVNKVYLDAYTRSGGIYAEARDRMMRALDEGVVWWTFIGHANTTSWTGDGILNYSDLNKFYLRHLPFIYAATCDFLRLDGTSVSGAEMMYKERYGGCIGVISATRPVYIAENGPLSAAVGRALAERDSQGRIYTPGEIYMRAKNDIRNSEGRPSADDNRFRYVFVGDPALRLAVPSNRVVIDKINGTPTDGSSDEPPTMAARSRSQIEGRVVSPDGTLLEDFDGTVSVNLLDSEYTTTTTPEDGSDPINFEELGARVFTGSARVQGGRFTMEVPMPTELSQNYRPAALASYAYHDTAATEAAGMFRDFYVYGYDEEAPADDVAPTIQSMVLNHSSFVNGGLVNPSPMLIAAVTDDVGINISTAGIGHQLSITLDSIRTFNDVAAYYTPYSDGTPGGVINYPFEDLLEGPHTLQLRVWDTSGNSERATIDFTVAQDIAPKIYDVYSDANPAITSANFYLSHDRPDAMLDVTVTVYDLLGRQIWSGSSSGRSDMFLSVPVTWDLTDGAGRRVRRGIYLYRATISDNGTTFETATRKLAVS